MKKWYYWWVSSGIWVLAAVINYFDGKSILGSVISASIFLLFGIAQFFCDRHGEKGKMVMRYICITGTVLVAVFLVAVLIFVLL